MPQPAQYYPKIDYRSHPAYRDLDVPPREDEEAVNDMIAEIDAAMSALNGSGTHDPESLAAAFKAGPVSKIRALASHLRETVSNPRVAGWLVRAFENVEQELYEQAKIDNRRCGAEQLHLQEEALQFADDMKRDGCKILRLEPETKARLRSLCEPAIRALREKAAIRKTCFRSMPTVQQFLRACGNLMQSIFAASRIFCNGGIRRSSGA